MLKDRELAAASETAIWNSVSTEIKNINDGAFYIQDMKRWVNEMAHDGQLEKFIQKYDLPSTTKEQIIAASTSLNNDFIGEDEVYEGRVNPKILYDYQIFVLINDRGDGVMHIYIVHENSLSGNQISAISTKLGFSLGSSINPNIDILE